MSGAQYFLYIVWGTVFSRKKLSRGDVYGGTNFPITPSCHNNRLYHNYVTIFQAAYFLWVQMSKFNTPARKEGLGTRLRVAYTTEEVPHIYGCLGYKSALLSPHLSRFFLCLATIVCTPEGVKTSTYERIYINRAAGYYNSKRNKNTQNLLSAR